MRETMRDLYEGSNGGTMRETQKGNNEGNISAKQCLKGGRETGEGNNKENMGGKHWKETIRKTWGKLGSKAQQEKTGGKR